MKLSLVLLLLSTTATFAAEGDGKQFTPYPSSNPPAGYTPGNNNSQNAPNNYQLNIQLQQLLAQRGQSGTGWPGLDASGNVISNNAYIGSVNPSVSTAGNNLATAQVLTNYHSQIVQCLIGGVKLPPPSIIPIGGEIWIYNRCGAAATIYPDSQYTEIETLGLGTSGYILNNVDAHLVRISATQWLQ